MCRLRRSLTDYWRVLPLNSWLLVAAIVVHLAISACAPKSTPVHAHPRYGWVIDHGTDPYDQGIHIVMPAAAPSIQYRFRPLPITDEQGNYLGIHEGIDISGKIGDPILSPARRQSPQSRRRATGAAR